jgi:hypothetical protein
MINEPPLNFVGVLKNIVLACEANGLRELPFVRDGRHIVDILDYSTSSDLVEELREAASSETMMEFGGKPPSRSELLQKAADTLEALSPTATSIGWETAAEREMEQQVFHACGRADVPKDVQNLIAEVWKRYCLVATPEGLDSSMQTPDLTEVQVEIARTTYLAKVKEYDRDFEREDRPEGFWEKKYGTNLHATYLGERWAMKAALSAVLSEIGRLHGGVQHPASEVCDHKAVSIAKRLSERTDFNLRIMDLWSDGAKDMAAYILGSHFLGERVSSKCFVIDYKIDEEPVETKLFDYHTQQPQAEAFCESVKHRGGAVNIKVRDVGSPA